MRLCGINGALIFDGSDFGLTSEYLIKMRDMQEHRGPDGAGYGYQIIGVWVWGTGDYLSLIYQKV